MNAYLSTRPVLTGLLCALALAAGLVVGSVVSGLVHDATALPPCPTEDSVHCYWDASTMGNGSGVDVVAP